MNTESTRRLRLAAGSIAALGGAIFVAMTTLSLVAAPTTHGSDPWHDILAAAVPAGIISGIACACGCIVLCATSREYRVAALAARGIVVLVLILVFL
jgi:hypothetical protein